MEKRIAVLTALIMMSCSELPDELFVPDATFMSNKPKESSGPAPDTTNCMNQGTQESGPETSADLSKFQFSGCPIANLNLNEMTNRLELKINQQGINDLSLGQEQSCWIGTGISPSMPWKSISVNATNILLKDQYTGKDRQYRFELLVGYSWAAGPILLTGRVANTDGDQELKFKTLSNVSAQEIYIGFRILRTGSAQFNVNSNQYFEINKISVK